MGDRSDESSTQATITPASAGVGPLLQRDYWAEICDTSLNPSELAAAVRAHFASFAPENLAAFEGGTAPLELQDELDIRIPGAGECRVRVVHLDAQSLTLATLLGHPEAGRITFGCYRGPRGNPIFHIRSRARSDSLLRLFGFKVVGEAMQTNTWAQFVSRVAAFGGGNIPGFVHAEMQTIEDEEDGPIDRPTFLARGD